MAHVANIFSLSKSLKNLYLNEIRKFAKNLDNFFKDQYERTFDFAIAGSRIQEIITEFNIEINYEQNSYDFIFEEKKIKLSQKDKEFLDDKDKSFVFYTSILQDLIYISLYISYSHYFFDKILDKQDALEREGKSEEQISEFITQNICLDNIYQNYSYFLNSSESDESFCVLSYKTNPLIIKYMQEHDISDDIANDIEHYLKIKELYLFTNKIDDEEYHKALNRTVNNFLDKNINPSFLFFTDRFASVKYKDLIGKIATKFISANKKYSIAKLASSILMKEQALTNTISLSILIADYVSDKARNKNIDRYINKINYLSILSNLYLDIEMKSVVLYNQLLNEDLSDVFLGEIDDHDEILDISNMVFNMANMLSIVISKRKLMDRSKYLCSAPHLLNVKRINACLKQEEQKEIVNTCYQLKDNNTLELKDNLSVSDLRALTLMLDNVGYFTATGLVKGLVG